MRQGVNQNFCWALALYFSGVKYDAAMRRRYQFRLRTLLLFFAFLGIYITLFRLVWHWMLLLTTTAIPLVASLTMVQWWTRLPGEKRTPFRAAIFTAAAVVTWLPWVVFFVLGPGEAVFNATHEVIPGTDSFIEKWNGVWQGR